MDMRISKKGFTLVIVTLILIVATVIVFFPVKNVNVVFNRCMNSDEIATVFRDTSFKSFQAYSVYQDSAGLSITSNSQLFGNPLEGTALSAAIDAEPRSTGVIVIDGSVSLNDMSKIKKSPFVDDVIVYFPILDGGDRDILPVSSQRFYEKHPEARYWE